MIQGQYKNQKYAILQTGPLGLLEKPENLIWGNEDDNARDLMNELRLLVLGQYFVESFMRRASCANVSDKLPRKSLFYCDGRTY